MNTTRREFMHQVGVTLAGLLLSGCDVASRLVSPPTPTMPVVVRECYIPVQVEPTSPSNNEHWRALRTCWLDLRDSRLQSPGDTTFSNDLRRRHTEALQALVANKELQADVADEIGIAFGEAITHIKRQMATCYAPLQPGEADPYLPREELMTQAAALTEMAGRSNIDPDTVARARDAMARDMAWLTQFQAGQSPGELSSIEATPTQIEAARILVELLLEKK